MTDLGVAARTFVFGGAYEDIDAHYQEQGWTDGLPIVPPTAAVVGGTMGSPSVQPCSW